MSRISELPASPGLTLTDVFPTVQADGASFITRKATGAQLLALIEDNLPAPTASVTSVVGATGVVTAAQVAAGLGYRRSIKEFGATGDGTTDDGPAIQAAMDAGVPLLVTPGTYITNQQLLFNSWVDIEGTDRKTCVFKRGPTMLRTAAMFTSAVISADKTRPILSPRFAKLGFTGHASYPLWLSTAGGTPVADPQADYLPGGVLAAVPGGATGTVVVSGGKVTGITLGSGGAGYLVPPVVIISGDGYGATATAVLSAGVVSSFFISEGGLNYTTATVSVVGGGAGPAALITADRRNASYLDLGNQIYFIKCVNPVVEGCYFFNYDGNQIADGGCLNGQFRDNLFENGGQIDFVGSALWAGGYKPPTSPDADALGTEGVVFERNVVLNWRRSAVTWRPTGGGAIRNNVVDGFGETAFFCAAHSGRTIIAGNIVKNSFITDIVSSAIEVEKDCAPFIIEGNIFEDIDGWAIDVMSKNVLIEGNTFVNCPSWLNRTVPYGPFSERYGFAPGAVPVAGAQRQAHLHAIAILTPSALAADAPSGIRIVSNTFVDDRPSDDRPKALIGFIGGALDAMEDIIIEGNDMTAVTNGTPLFDQAEYDRYVAPAGRVIIGKNLGRVEDDTLSGPEIATLLEGNLYPTTGAMARTVSEYAFRRRFLAPDGGVQMQVDQVPLATEYWRMGGGIAGAGAWLMSWADAADNANAVVVAKGEGTITLGNGAGPMLEGRDTGADKQMDAPVYVRGGAQDYTTHPSLMAPNLRALWLGIDTRPLVRLSEDVSGDATQTGWRISASSTAAKMQAEGAATNISLYVAGKGTGNITLGNVTNGNILLLQPSAGAAVNVPYIQPGTSGQPADIAMNPANNVPLRLGVNGRTSIAGGFIRGGKVVRNAGTGYAALTLNGTTSRVFIDGAGTIAAADFTMPPSADLTDGQEISFTASQTVTTLTLTANTAQTLVGAPTTMGVTTPFALCFDSTTGKWTRV